MMERERGSGTAAGRSRVDTPEFPQLPVASGPKALPIVIVTKAIHAAIRQEQGKRLAFMETTELASR